MERMYTLPDYMDDTVYRCFTVAPVLLSPTGVETAIILKLSLVTRKPVFGVCDMARLKPACSAIETS